MNMNWSLKVTACRVERVQLLGSVEGVLAGRLTLARHLLPDRGH